MQPATHSRPATRSRAECGIRAPGTATSMARISPSTTPRNPTAVLQNLHVIWADLIAASDADTARRLGDGPRHATPDPPRAHRPDESGRHARLHRHLDQLLAEKRVWIPSLDVYVTGGDGPRPFAQHRKELAAMRRPAHPRPASHRRPEATYAPVHRRGRTWAIPPTSPRSSTAPGHIVCLTWDSAIAKFGIDRGAGVWNDYGNPDHFRLWFDFGDLAKGIARTWKGQRLEDGLPVITTMFEQRRRALRSRAVRLPAGWPAPRAARRHRHGAAAAACA